MVTILKGPDNQDAPVTKFTETVTPSTSRTVYPPDFIYKNLTGSRIPGNLQ